MKKVLIIEDDLSLRPIYENKLGEEGYKILWAPTGDKGIEMAKKDMPNIILLDIMLPGIMDGLEVMRELKSDPAVSAIPIIVTTNMVGAGEKAKEAGAVDFVIKTNIALKDLMAKVKNYCIP